MSQPAKWDVWLYWWGWGTAGTAEFVVQCEPIPLPAVDLWVTVQGRIDWDKGETECPPICPVDRPLQLGAHIATPERDA